MMNPTHWNMKALRTLLVEADSALSLIYHRAGMTIQDKFGADFRREIGELSSRCREASEALSEYEG